MFVVVIVFKKGFVCTLIQNGLLILSKIFWDNEFVIILYSEGNKF